MTTEPNAVFHYRDGKTTRGTIETELSPESTAFRASVEGTSADIQVDDLKAVFFLRVEGAGEAEQPGGSILAVEFFDGEVIRGRSAGFNPGRSGFYLFPADRSKIEKIFVVSSAVVSTDVEKL